ncbi:uncharacterized protein BX664DRAFT_84952 [Halteromyces radiatus]|uniref:uncharacterized protein n=1 Tax=Halteromyces radiatus TaxID=101107 RepID=UPI00221F2873|nr:uncharacterized protein BX664DRAFT_84952 [Halteromyces radiatus]KAI8097697.1 hypothetical protein BX664DRAFT_84952 [Halteromyces radiatus]
MGLYIDYSFFFIFIILDRTVIKQEHMDDNTNLSTLKESNITSKNISDDGNDESTQQPKKESMDTATIPIATTKDTNMNDTMDIDLDDGELSDASSASTIPLDDDDREWTLRPQQRQKGKPVEASIKSSQETTVPIASSQNKDEQGTVTSSTSVDSVKQLEEKAAKQDQTTTKLESDQVNKPKVKVSLQEYLSRRMANQDSSTSINTNNTIPFTSEQQKQQHHMADNDQSR